MFVSALVSLSLTFFILRSLSIRMVPGHRSEPAVFSVNAIQFHPKHGTFVTVGGGQSALRGKTGSAGCSGQRGADAV